jgi:L-threonylcarbamoyladenylate synthase
MKYIGARGATGARGARGATGAVSDGPNGNANCIDGRITQLVTDVLQVDPTAPEPELIARAAACLRAGGLVAFPTETVYGLGAHALDRRAVQRVFAAKERPGNDPLIVHVAALDDIAPLVVEIPPAARDLAVRFWPGPLTIVLRRTKHVPDEVTAGLDTVAIRVPSHPIAQALLQRSRLPIAAPSANRFSRPSPTRAAHVLADLGGRVDMILDGGPTSVGLESTVVHLADQPPTVLRPGAIDVAALRAVIPDVRIRSSPAERGTAGMPAPGMLPKHYAPATPLMLFEGDRLSAIEQIEHTARRKRERGQSVAILAFSDDLKRLRTVCVHVVDLGNENDPPAVASRLYAALREGDELGVDVILVRNITTDHPLSAAIQDRLRRASASPSPFPLA